MSNSIPLKYYRKASNAPRRRQRHLWRQTRTCHWLSAAERANFLLRPCCLRGSGRSHDDRRDRCSAVADSRVPDLALVACGRDKFRGKPGSRRVRCRLAVPGSRRVRGRLAVPCSRCSLEVDSRGPDPWARDIHGPGLWGHDTRVPGPWERDIHGPGLWGHDTRVPGL